MQYFTSTDRTRQSVLLFPLPLVRKTSAIQDPTKIQCVNGEESNSEANSVLAGEGAPSPAGVRMAGHGGCAELFSV